MDDLFSLQLLLKNCSIELNLFKSSGFIWSKEIYVDFYNLREECAYLPISYEATLKLNKLKPYNYFLSVFLLVDRRYSVDVR